MSSVLFPQNNPSRLKIGPVCVLEFSVRDRDLESLMVFKSLPSW